jgi:hypothetical protein
VLLPFPAHDELEQKAKQQHEQRKSNQKLS